MKHHHWVDRAQQLASWSKDPTTKVGCVLVRYAHVVAEGYNGFVHGADDEEATTMDRELKRMRTVHAEANAVAHAARFGHPTQGSTAYITHFPCATCAGLLVQAGVEAVYIDGRSIALHPSWGESVAMGQAILRDAGVPCNLLP